MTKKLTITGTNQSYHLQHYLYWILLILYTNLIIIESNNIEINRIKLTNSNINTKLTITYANSYKNAPIFSYFVQEMNVISVTQMVVNHSLATVQNTRIHIQFDLYCFVSGIPRNSLIGTQYIMLSIMVTDQYDGIQLGVMGDLLIDGNSKAIIKYQNQYNEVSQFKLMPFGLNFPLIFTISQKYTTHSVLLFTQFSQFSFQSYTSLSYLVINKKHTLHNIFVVFDQVQTGNPNWIIFIDSEGFVDPKQEAIFIGLESFNTTSTLTVLKKYANYDYIDPATLKRAIQIGYQALSITATAIRSSVIIFNNKDIQCSIDGVVGSLFAYQILFKTLPSSCLACNWKCLTCTSDSNDPYYTDEQYCLTCPNGRYLSPIYTGSQRGQCICLKGLKTDASDKCIPCQFNCLVFIPTFLRASTDTKFLLTFSQGDLIFDMQLSDNLQVSVNSQKIQYNITEHREGAYLISVQKSVLKPCQEKCDVNFFFKIPFNVRTQKKYLSEQQKSIQIRNFYVIQQMMPENLSEVFLIISTLIAVSAATGQSSFLRVLFELEQIIQFHKYLNLDIPVVFKQFIEALSAFSFMDIFALIPFDIIEPLQNASSNALDLKGAPKIIFYLNGSNFYKNIISAILSFLSIILINFVIFLLLKIMPCDCCKTLAEKIRIRWIITLSDMIESLGLPVFFFALIQINCLPPSAQMQWIGALTFGISLLVFLFPFFSLMYAMFLKKKQMTELVQQILQDLFQDCKINSSMTYFNYLYTFFRKILLAMFLISSLPGLIQITGIILANIIQLLINVYLIKEGLFISKIKSVTRTLNILCLVSIEVLIIVYNMNYSQLDEMILMGIACTYFAIIATVIGFLQMIIKISDIIFQKLTGDQQTINNRLVVPENYQKTTQKFTCNIGKSLMYTNQPSSKRQLYEQKVEYNQNEASQAGYSDIIPISSEQSVIISNPLSIASQVRSLIQSDNKTQQKGITNTKNTQNIKNIKNKRYQKYNKQQQQQQLQYDNTRKKIRNSYFNEKNNLQANANSNNNQSNLRQQDADNNKQSYRRKRRYNNNKGQVKKQRNSADITNSLKVNINNNNNNKASDNKMNHSANIKKKESKDIDNSSSMSDIVEIQYEDDGF